VDVITEPSRLNEAASLDLTTTYHHDRETDVFVRSGFHVEEEWRSYNLGGGFSRSLAEDNATVSVSVNQVWDWFDRFFFDGTRLGHATRSSTNANVSLTQLLSPTTIANVNYGLTVQVGTLGNTWQIVPLSDGTIGEEQLPWLRQRHAFVGRIAQWLPWNGAVKGSYRFYVDNWGLSAHTLEAELYQRISPEFYVRFNYRFHYQTGVDFFSIDAPPDAQYRTADSDLAPFHAQTVGLKAALDLPLLHSSVRELHADVGFERYVRSNGLNASIASCSFGLRFR
jgi:hypothetical protein